MKAKSFINYYRRCVMRTLTRKMGSAHTYSHLDKENVHRILVSRPNNRLGNQLLITPLIQELLVIFPDCEIYLFVRGKLAPEIFRNYPHVNYIMLPDRPFRHIISYLCVWILLMREHYDLAINTVCDSSSGRLSIKLSKADYKIYDISCDELLSKYEDYSHMAKHPVYNVRKALGLNKVKSVPMLNIKVSSDEKEDGRKILEEIVNERKRTICIYTYATGEKCYSRQWWSCFYNGLKQRYGNDFNILEVLPKGKLSQIDYQAPTFYSNKIREIASLLSNADLFIGADCGIMHLAVASGITTIGLFSVTDIKRYGPYGNHNIGLDTNEYSMSDIFPIIQKILKRVVSEQ